MNFVSSIVEVPFDCCTFLIKILFRSNLVGFLKWSFFFLFEAPVLDFLVATEYSWNSFCLVYKKKNFCLVRVPDWNLVWKWFWGFFNEISFSWMPKSALLMKIPETICFLFCNWCKCALNSALLVVLFHLLEVLRSCYV